MSADSKRKRRRLFAVWYLLIGIAFLFLAGFRLAIGERLWLVGLRLVIAAGFFILSWIELRAARRTG